MDLSLLIRNAYAQVNADAFGRAVNPIFTHIIDPLIGLLFAVAVVVFAYGVFQVIWGEPGGEAQDRGKKSMWGGIIGMFIMLSAWGIIQIVSNTIKSI